MMMMMMMRDGDYLLLALCKETCKVDICSLLFEVCLPEVVFKKNGTSDDGVIHAKILFLDSRSDVPDALNCKYYLRFIGTNLSSSQTLRAHLNSPRWESQTEDCLCLPVPSIRP